MSSERATVRPVTLARLVEVTFLCTDELTSTEAVETELDVTHRRARETILEAERINLIEEIDGTDQQYDATKSGEQFIEAIKREEWSTVDEILRTQSPHYVAFLETLHGSDPVPPEKALEALEDRSESTQYEYNETSLDVIGDWAQRLGVIQRNAFTGAFYLIEDDSIPETFPAELISTVNEMESTAGVNLQQRYFSVPQVREHLCEKLGCTRADFDDALVQLAEQNVGRLEFSGAPIDTGAKDARYGIKTMDYADDDGIVTTDQSSEQIMSGVEMLGKQYYYLAIHDEDLTFDYQ